MVSPVLQMCNKKGFKRLNIIPDDSTYNQNYRTDSFEMSFYLFYNQQLHQTKLYIKKKSIKKHVPAKTVPCAAR
jgi:hypothetical protein